MEDIMEFPLISEYTYRYEPLEIMVIFCAAPVTALMSWLITWFAPSWLPVIALALPLNYIGFGLLTLWFLPEYTKRVSRFNAFCRRYAPYEIKATWAAFIVIVCSLTAGFFLMILLCEKSHTLIMLTAINMIGTTLLYIAWSLLGLSRYWEARGNLLDAEVRSTE
jgi:hypothetical protein